MLFGFSEMSISVNNMYHASSDEIPQRNKRYIVVLNGLDTT